jgi:hypothetical protein
LISYFFRKEFDDVEDLPITFYRRLLSQAMNLGNLLRQGEFEMQTDDEKQEQALEEYKRLVKEGRFPKRGK